MCFEDNYAHSDYKYHKHIDPSQNGPSHTPKDSESKTALNLPQSSLVHIVASKWNNIPVYH